jgi:hypothetical protein
MVNLRLIISTLRILVDTYLIFSVIKGSTNVDEAVIQAFQFTMSIVLFPRLHVFEHLLLHVDYLLSIN